MAITLAIKTKEAINACLEADQGASYRQFLQKVLPHMADAYRGVDEDGGFRSHLGASMVGRPCAREIWFGFRWAKKPKFPARILRLFNRGHLEEARFLAMLLAIGVQVYQQDANGKQFRISDLGGHFGGSGDGVGIGIPDLNPSSPCLLEFKTHNKKSFDKLAKEGVMVAKPEHYAQMQTYMRKMSIPVAMYGAVNKDDDELHLEIVHLDTLLADQYLDRGRAIIMMRQAPKKINDSAGWYQCTYCEMKRICHYNEPMDKNCRTCHYSFPQFDGTWQCGEPTQQGLILSKEEQLAGCGHHLELTK